MSVTLQIKRATAASWLSADPVLASGELGLETDTGKMKAGDGSTTWFALPYLTVHDHAGGGGGGGGGTGSTYVHAQTTPATTWTIEHDLDAFLNVTVVTSTGVQVEGDVLFQDANTIVIQFANAFSGYAYLS